MSITHADALRWFSRSPVQGGTERIAAWVADRCYLEDHLRDEFGTGGRNGDDGAGWWSPKGFRLTIGEETVEWKWTHVATLMLHDVPMQPCTPAECDKCEPRGGNHVQCSQTHVYHSWGMACPIKAAPLSLFDLAEFDEPEDEDEDA